MSGSGFTVAGSGLWQAFGTFWLAIIGFRLCSVYGHGFILAIYRWGGISLMVIRFRGARIARTY